MLARLFIILTWQLGLGNGMEISILELLAHYKVTKTMKYSLGVTDPWTFLF